MEAKGKILIVDDDDITRKILSPLLAKDGHKTVVASTGKEAINLLGKHSFDLVITDLGLGEMNGIAILTEVKNELSDTSV